MNIGGHWLFGRPDEIYIENDVDKVGNYYSTYSYTSEVSSLKVWYDFSRAGVLSDKQIQPQIMLEVLCFLLIVMDLLIVRYKEMQIMLPHRNVDM